MNNGRDLDLRHFSHHAKEPVLGSNVSPLQKTKEKWIDDKTHNTFSAMKNEKISPVKQSEKNLSKAKARWETANSVLNFRFFPYRWKLYLFFSSVEWWPLEKGHKGLRWCLSLLTWPSGRVSMKKGTSELKNRLNEEKVGAGKEMTKCTNKLPSCQKNPSA